MVNRLVLKGSTVSKWSCRGKGAFLLILSILVAHGVNSPLYGQQRELRSRAMSQIKATPPFLMPRSK
jgi:hypothetical protein